MSFFSVIIPTYNRPRELQRAVSSVLEQSFRDFELLIINNGEPIRKEDFTHEKIKILNEKQKGANYARNKGIEEAKGNFICFLDDDDEYLPHHLRTLNKLIEKNNFEAGFYKTFARREIKPGVYEDQDDPLKPEGMHNLHYSFLYPLNMNSICIHNEILKKHRFNPEIKVAQDYDLWIRILAENKMFIAPEVTTVYHLSGESTSKPSKEKYYHYIKLFKGYFNDPKYSKLIPEDVKSDRIFRYYYWMLCEFKKELGFLEFMKVAGNIIRYKPKMLFTKQLYSVCFK